MLGLSFSVLSRFAGDMHICIVSRSFICFWQVYVFLICNTYLYDTFLTYISRNESNIMEAASAGATTAVKLVAFVVVNLIAFIAILAFIDAVISYYGSRVGHPEVNFEVC